MKKIILVALFFAFEFSCYGMRARYALDPITKVDKLDILERIAENISEQEAQETVFIFDMDDTLIYDKSACLQPQNHEKMRDIVLGMNMLSYEMFLSNFYMAAQSQCKLVDDKFIKIINTLKQKNSKLLILTYSSHGTCGIFDPNAPIEWFHEFGLNSKIKSFADFRIMQLADRGISLNPWFDIDAGSKLFNGNGDSPLFKSGFIFCNYTRHGGERNELNRKCLVLNKLFNSLGWWPKAIVWTDDNIKCLEDAVLLFNDIHVDVIGLNYLGASKFERVFDPQIATFQINYAIHNKYKKWIDDETVARILTVSCTNCSPTCVLL